MENLKRLERELELVKKELEETKQKFYKARDIIFDCSCDIDKTFSLLNYWTREYGFSNKPDARAALRWSSQVPNENTDTDKDKVLGQQSFKWFYEYDNIFNFVDIATDYVFKTKEALEKGLK